MGLCRTEAEAEAVADAGAPVATNVPAAVPAVIPNSRRRVTAVGSPLNSRTCRK
jgi:hypothetical protein